MLFGLLQPCCRFENSSLLLTLAVKGILDASQQAVDGKAAAGLQQSKGGPVRLFAVFAGNFVVLEAEDCFQPRGRDGFSELPGTAPFPVRTDTHEAMVDCILVDVVQASQIAPLKR